MSDATKVDILISGGTVITMGEGTKKDIVIDDGVVAISGGAISFVGRRDTEKDKFSAGKDIDARGCVVMPGFINGHTHAAMSLFRGISDDLPLEMWLHNYIFPAESKNLTADFVYWGTKLACVEMLLGGITTFCDMYLFEDAAAKATKEMGMRGVLGEVLYNFPSPNYGPLEEGFAYTEQFIQKWRGDLLITPAVEPHALDTCSPELLVRAKEIARKYNTPYIVHVAETRENIDHVMKNYGKSSFEYLDGLGVLDGRFIADHAVWINEREIEIMRERGVTVVTNPESNMKLVSGHAPIHRYLERGVVVGLGTDGCASNNNLDILAEMDTLAKLHKIYDHDPTHLDALTVLRLATRSGAHALRLGEEVGTLAVGKKADIIIIDFNKPHLTPVYDYFSHLVYAAIASDVRDVIVNGEILVKDRELLLADTGEIMAKGRELARRVKKTLE